MRLLAKRPVIVKDVVIGHEKPAICMPIAADNSTNLLDQARKNMAKQPDLIEWRADYFASVADQTSLGRNLEELGRIAGRTPMIFTCRSFAEGGAQAIGPGLRKAIFETAVASGVPSLIDVELFSGAGLVEWITAAATAHGIKTILSYHNFDTTPPVEQVINILKAAQNRGGDIAKVALMPRHQGDLLNLFRATLAARENGLDIPMAAIAMGQLGVITRTAGWLFGSDITFAAGDKSTAPGQIPIEELRKSIETLMKG